MELDKLRRRVPPAVAAQLDILYAEFLRLQPLGRNQDFLKWLRDRHLVDEALLRKGTDQLELSSLPEVEDTNSLMAANQIKTFDTERYSALGEVGKGSVGEILLMKDLALKRKVAVKQIRPELAQHPQVFARFLTEAQITAQLDHPGIVPVYGLEIQAGKQLAYAMKLIEGKTLKDLIRETRLEQEKKQKVEKEEYTLSSRLEHFLKVCDALDYAHSRGVIHRDLKPANIMIGPFREVYIMDWGIARRIQDNDEDLDPELAQQIAPDQGEPLLERTQLGEVLGTPRYMSPEQAAGRNNELDGRSDQFSLGLILYELVTLKPAFQAKNSLELLQKVLKGKLEPITHKHLPIELRAIIAKATALNPTLRYPSVSELSTDLRRFLRGEAVMARPDHLGQKLLRWMGNHRQATLNIALSVFVFCLLGLSLSIYIQQETVLKIRAREQKITPLLNQISRLSQTLRRSMLQQEALLEGLSATAVAALNEGQAQNQIPFKIPDWQKNPPANAMQSAFYQKLIDLNSPVYLSTKPLAQFEPLIKLLLPLQGLYRRTLLHSAAYGQETPLGTEAEIQISQKGTPLVELGLVLSQGLTILYPGQKRAVSDLRQQEWYQASLKTQQGLWTKLPTEPVFRISQALKSVGPKDLGVAYIDLQADYLQKALKLPADQPALTALYLLGKEAQIVASNRPEKVNKKFTLPDKLELQAPGFSENQDQLLVWQPLHQGWTLLATIDLKRLLNP
jgi:eukaryotic-like serine/threonine-protein kinase